MPHVLLVDDDAVQAAVYARLLQGRGFTTQVTTDRREAVDAFLQRVPDAVVVDLGLPRMDGVELIRAVRELPGGRAVRVFVLANAFLELEALAAWEAGADQIVGKSSYPPEQILEFLIAEVGGGGTTRAAKTVGDPALADFLARAARYVRDCRQHLELVRTKGYAEDPVEDIATAMRRLQAAQAFGIPEIPQVAAVAEWLTRALVAWPSSVGPSSLRTLTQAIDIVERRLRAPDAPVRDLPRCRALGVDDDATSRLLVQQAFRKIRVPCDLAPDGAAGLAAAKSHRYDLIVSDVMMPAMDGFEMVEHVREDLEGYEDVPVIYVTALDGFDETVRRDPHGGADAIVKPYLIMELATKAVVHLFRGAPAA